MQRFICIINDGYQEVTDLVSKTNSNCIEYDIYSHNTSLKMYFPDICFHLEIHSSGNQFAHESMCKLLIVQAANV